MAKKSKKTKAEILPVEELIQWLDIYLAETSQFYQFKDWVEENGFKVEEFGLSED